MALNPSVSATNNTTQVGRVVGWNDGGSLANNWARNNMTVTQGSTSKTLDKGLDKVDGADCDAIPAASWWTTAVPNGPGWSSEAWSFVNGQWPRLRWELE